MVEEVEPTVEQLEEMAAKQLLLELTRIKNQVYNSKTVMNSVLVTQLQQLARGLTTKYNTFGLFKGETIKVKLSNYGKRANFRFVYSPRLNTLMTAALASVNLEQSEKVTAE